MIPIAKYLKTAQMQATSYISEGPLFVPYMVLRFLRVAVILAVWRAVFSGRAEVDGMALPTLLTYTLIAAVFADQFVSETRIVNDMWDGTIATKMLQPLPMEGIYIAEMVGEWSIGLVLVSVPLFCAAPLFGVNPLPADTTAGLLFIPSLLMAIAVGVALDMLLGAVTMMFNLSVWLLDQLRSALGAVLTGAFIPLALMPWGLGRLLEYLPFAAMASAPLRIYTRTGDAPRLLAIQLCWCVLLWPLARYVWAANREKMVSHGG